MVPGKNQVILREVLLLSLIHISSFIRSAKDVLEIKRVLEECGGSDVHIISKIENRDGVDNIDEILEVTDGIMVARGDLGVEIPFEEVPLVQKLLKMCIRDSPEAIPINFLLPIKGTPFENVDTSILTPNYCLKVLCLARLLVPQADIRCAAGREIYFKGDEKRLLSVVNSIFASGYLTEDGQGIKDTIKAITDAGFTYEIESA